MKRVLTLFVFSLTSIAIVAGCSKSSDHNAQDVSFAQGMIPHHQQAVQMADMALAKAQSAGVKDLASRIKAAQSPEIDQMSGWLTSWGKGTTPSGGSVAGHDMGGSSAMPAGMMSDADMQALDGASGAAFDKLFLKGMTAHHSGAVEMAKVEQAKGKFGPAIALAKNIQAAQEKEISEMNRLLAAVNG